MFGFATDNRVNDKNSESGDGLFHAQQGLSYDIKGYLRLTLGRGHAKGHHRGWRRRSGNSSTVRVSTLPIQVRAVYDGRGSSRGCSSGGASFFPAPAGGARLTPSS